MSATTFSRMFVPMLFAAASAAQSFNIDVYTPPSLSPPATYGAFPGQKGVWNTILPLAAPQPLMRLNAAVDDTTIAFAPEPGTALQTAIPAPHTELYEDFAYGDFTVTITNLASGSYVLVLYSWYPTVAATFTVTDGTGVPQSLPVVCGGPPFPGFVDNVSMARFSIAMTSASSTLTIQVAGAGGEGAVLNGLQLVHYQPSPNNCPQPVNSLGAVPAVVASGTINPTTGGISIAANDLNLHVGLLPAPALPLNVGAILCWGSNDHAASVAQVCPAVGTRCIGAIDITRVFDPTAPAGSGGVGTTTINGTYNLAVDFNALIAQGLTVAPGLRLHFQMFYRDHANPNECSGSGTSVLRWTNSVSVLLAP